MNRHTMHLYALLFAVPIMLIIVFVITYGEVQQQRPLPPVVEVVLLAAAAILPVVLSAIRLLIHVDERTPIWREMFSTIICVLMLCFFAYHAEWMVEDYLVIIIAFMAGVVAWHMPTIFFKGEYEALGVVPTCTATVGHLVAFVGVTIGGQYMRMGKTNPDGYDIGFFLIILLSAVLICCICITYSYIIKCTRVRACDVH